MSRTVDGSWVATFDVIDISVVTDNPDVDCSFVVINKSGVDVS